MKLSRKYQVLWIVLLFTINNTESAEEDYDNDSELSRTHRFQGPPERTCRYRRQEGVCRRRSECNTPTRRTCRFGMDPIICCMDKDEPIWTTTTTRRATRTTTTTRRPTQTNRPPQPTENIEKIDITFPNCGSRSPKVSENTRTSGARSLSRRRGRLTKREVIAHLTLTRHKRWSSVVRPIIVGGREAKSNSWPWMVAIYKTSVSGGTKRFFCGASLISRKYVVSAAHCFDGENNNIDASKFSIVVGSHTTKDGTEYPVENVLIHPGYQRRLYYNDLCLLKIRKQVTLTNKVYPVCLPSNGLRNKIIPDANNVTVTGWGDTTFGGVSSKVLQEVSMPIIPLKECNTSYSKIAKANFPRGITNLFICAGLREGGKDACQGDSGGPMVTILKDHNWVQLGVVSFGYGCAQAGFPGVYTRLSQYTKWIYENTDLGR